MSEDAGMTEEDFYRGLITSANQLHRARITAWLAGNISWSLTTQPSSLNMALGQTGLINFSQSLARFAKRDLKVIWEDIKMIPDELLDAKGKTMKEAFKNWAIDRKLMRHIQRVGGTEQSVVSELKGSGVNMGRIAETAERVQNRIDQSRRQYIANKANTFAGLVEARTVDISFTAGKIKAEKMGLTPEAAVMYGDYVAALTQSMYDQITRNRTINSKALKALAPMQSYVFSAWTNVGEIMGGTGVEKAKSERVKQAVLWYAGMRSWETLVSIFIHGDDPEKAVFDPSYRKSYLSSVIPFSDTVADILPFLSVNSAARWIKNMALPERFEESDKSWADKTPIQQFIDSTDRAFTDKDDKKPDFLQRQAMAKWAMQYITPYFGVAGTKIATDLMGTKFVDNQDGREWNITGNDYRYYPTLDGTDTEQWLSYLKATLFGKSSLEKSE
jgi:hypothetical protein